MTSPIGNLRAVILAAGKHAITPDGRPLILQPLGDRSVLEHVIQNALQLVSIEHLYVVVGYRQEEVRERLAPAIATSARKSLSAPHTRYCRRRRFCRISAVIC